MTDQVLTSLDAKKKLTDFKMDEVYHYELDENTDWIATILSELEENIEDSDEDRKKGFLRTQFNVKRKKSDPWGEHVLIQGSIQSNYQAACVRCLTICPKELDVEVSGGYVPEQLEKMPEYEESTTFYTSNAEYDMYFHRKNMVDFAEFIHEQVFMNVDNLPLHDKDCKGLCPECGVDRNKVDCGHKA